MAACSCKNVITAARGRALDTCPQATCIGFHKGIAEQFALPAGAMVVCGVSLGYTEENAAENKLVAEREAVSVLARFVG